MCQKGSQIERKTIKNWGFDKYVLKKNLENIPNKKNRE